jgi:hypothetical protein
MLKLKNLAKAWQVLFDQSATNQQLCGEILLLKVASRPLRVSLILVKSLSFKWLQGELTLARGVLSGLSLCVKVFAMGLKVICADAFAMRMKSLHFLSFLAKPGKQKHIQDWAIVSDTSRLGIRERGHQNGPDHNDFDRAENPKIRSGEISAHT